MSTRFGTTDYNPTGGSSGGGDYKDRDSMLLGQYAIIEFDLDRVGVYEGNYGKQMILNMDDVEVREGVITERTGDGDGEEGKLKVYGWDKWYSRDEDTMDLIPFDGSDEITIDELGRRVSEDAGSDTYKYRIEEGILEGRDQPADVGDRELWLSNGKKTRTLAKVLSERGHDIVDDDNKRDSREWLNADDDDEFQLRPELEDRRLMLWFKQTTLEPNDDNDLDEPVTFIDSVLLDAETEAGITIKNDESDGDEADDEAADADDGDDEAAEDAGTEPDSPDRDYPEDVNQVLDMFSRTGQTDRDSIESIVRDEAPADFDVDMDEIMDEIETRAERM